MSAILSENRPSSAGTASGHQNLLVGVFSPEVGLWLSGLWEELSYLVSPHRPSNLPP